MADMLSCISRFVEHVFSIVTLEKCFTWQMPLARGNGVYWTVAGSLEGDRDLFACITRSSPVGRLLRTILHGDNSRFHKGSG
jgi:hypothetical protein